MPMPTPRTPRNEIVPPQRNVVPPVNILPENRNKISKVIWKGLGITALLATAVAGAGASLYYGSPETFKSLQETIQKWMSDVGSSPTLKSAKEIFEKGRKGIVDSATQLASSETLRPAREAFDGFSAKALEWWENMKTYIWGAAPVAGVAVADPTPLVAPSVSHPGPPTLGAIDAAAPNLLAPVDTINEAITGGTDTVRRSGMPSPGPVSPALPAAPTLPTPPGTDIPLSDSGIRGDSGRGTNVPSIAPRRLPRPSGL